MRFDLIPNRAYQHEKKQSSKLIVSNVHMKKICAVRSLQENKNIGNKMESSGLIVGTQEQGFRCSSHPMKQATYYLLESSEKLYYCEKCSIMLASQGFSIFKIGTSGAPVAYAPPRHSNCQLSKHERKSEISSFLKGVTAAHSSLAAKNNKVLDLLQASEQNYSQILQEIEQYFHELTEAIEVQKYLSYNQVLTHRARCETEMRQLKDDIILKKNQLEEISYDIQSNLRTVETVNQETYESIMGNYSAKLLSLSFIIDFPLKKVVKPSVTIPSMPPQKMFEQIKISHAEPKPRYKTPQQQSIKRAGKMVQLSCSADRMHINRAYGAPRVSLYDPSKQRISFAPQYKTLYEMGQVGGRKKEELAFSFDSGKRNQMNSDEFEKKDLSIEQLNETESCLEEQSCDLNAQVSEKRGEKHEMQYSSAQISGYLSNNVLESMEADTLLLN